ncbi:TetR/AcrR family transcriptional regulator [bacterium]|nr:TetR/AcrR family transcriptional regulator [bacterium]
MGRPETVTSEQVYDQARVMFIEFGPTLPIKKIAEKLGVSDAALFKRFGSKEDLYVKSMGTDTAQLPEFGKIDSALLGRNKLKAACELTSLYLGQVTPAMLQLATSKNMGFQQADQLDFGEQIAALVGKFEVLLDELASESEQSSAERAGLAKTTVSALHMIAVYQFSKLEPTIIPSQDDIVQTAWNSMSGSQPEVPKPAVIKVKPKKLVAKPSKVEPPQQMDIFG